MLSRRNFFLAQESTIGLIAPSGIVTHEQVLNGAKYLEELGFQTKVDERCFQQTRFFAGSAELRAKIFCEMLSDPNIDAIMGIRGGSGSVQMLPFLDQFDCSSLPFKPILGFSDISTLLNYFADQKDWITFHTHVLTTLTNTTPEERTIWQAGLTQTPLFQKDLAEDYQDQYQVLFQGQEQGKLAGGNLATIVSNIGTPWELDYTDKILFLEEIGEYPYQIERLFTQLSFCGALQKVKGIVLGHFLNRGKKIPDDELLPIFDYYLRDLGIPVIANFPSGHGELNRTLPIGAKVQIRTSPPSIQCIDSRICS
ncbi:MAG: muramoyltetrapeptide carboxypeptidase [bacterium]